MRVVIKGSGKLDEIASLEDLQERPLFLKKIAEVEIRIARDGRIWINVDGICILRAREFWRVVIEDERD